LKIYQVEQLALLLREGRRVASLNFPKGTCFGKGALICMGGRKLRLPCYLIIIVKGRIHTPWELFRTFLSEILHYLVFKFRLPDNFHDLLNKLNF